MINWSKFTNEKSRSTTNNSWLISNDEIDNFYTNTNASVDTSERLKKLVDLCPNCVKRKAPNWDRDGELRKNPKDNLVAQKNYM